MATHTMATTMANLEEFDRGWLRALDHAPVPDLIEALVGLTRLGQRPTPIHRLATVLDRPLPQTETLLRDNLTAHIEHGLIHWDTPYPGRHTVRTLHVEDRDIPTGSGCAPDLFAHTAVLDIPFAGTDTCAATAAPIRIHFVPGGLARVDPPGTVVAVLPPELVEVHAATSAARINTNVCTHQPFFASAAAASGWLADHPGGRVFTPQEMFERPIFTYYRHHLRPLIHPSTDHGA